MVSLIRVPTCPLGAGQEDPRQAPRPPGGAERPAGHEDRVLQHQRDQAADGEAGGPGAAAIPHRRLGGVCRAAACRAPRGGGGGEGRAPRVGGVGAGAGCGYPQPAIWAPHAAWRASFVWPAQCLLKRKKGSLIVFQSSPHKSLDFKFLLKNRVQWTPVFPDSSQFSSGSSFPQSPPLPITPQSLSFTCHLVCLLSIGLRVLFRGLHRDSSGFDTPLLGDFSKCLNFSKLQCPHLFLARSRHSINGRYTAGTA